ncbi:MAG: glycosyltransferase family 39 protein [Chloroflexi bacterium]|nr:glycosyltransferase family 39 protein [Chloroflexota bacterium]
MAAAPTANTRLAYRWVRPEFILISGGAGLVLASQWIRQVWPGGPVALPLVLLACGAAAFLLGAQAIERGRLPGPVSPRLAAAAAWLGVAADQVLLLFLAVCLAVAATAAAGFGDLMVQPLVAVVTWILGIVFVVLGGWGQKVQRQAFPWRPLAWALALAAIALPLRAIDTAHIPVTLSGDEGLAGLSSLEFLRGEMNNLFRSSYYSYPALFFYFQSLSIAWLGRTAEALRLPAALAGAASVGGVYLLGRTLFDHRTGLVAGIFLAGFAYHIDFSRLGLTNVWDGLAFIVTLGALWYGWKKEQRAAFLAAGLALGFAQYLYASGRALLLLIPLVVLILGLLDFPRLKRLLPDLAIMALAALVVTLPMAWYYANHWGEYMAPMNRVTIFGNWMRLEMARTGLSEPAILVRQVWDGLRAYTDLPIRFFYTPGTPILRAGSATVFLLGVILLLWRWKDGRAWLLLIWLLAFGVMGGLSVDTPASQRYAAAAPAVAVVVAYGLTGFAGRLSSLWPRWTSWFSLAALILVVVMAVDDARFYFLDFTPRSDFGGDNTLVAQRLADDLKSRPGSWQVYFFGEPRMGYASIPSLPYLVSNAAGSDVKDPWEAAGIPLPADKATLFVFLPQHTDDLAAVRQIYPGGIESILYNRKGQLLYQAYAVAPAAFLPSAEAP